MITMSFQQGIIPDTQKHALVRPWIKKPLLDPLDLKSFQPISNYSLLLKMTEQLVVNRPNEHAGQYHLLPWRQWAYRKINSTEAAITIVHKKIVRTTDDGYVSALVLLDLSTALDNVDHDVLLDVLNLHSVSRIVR